MADNITLKTYKGGNVTPQDDAIIYETAIPGSGIFKGCEVTYARGNVLHISQGFGMIRGRFFEVYETEIDVRLADVGETLQGRVYIHLDLSNADEPIKILAQATVELPPLDADVNINYNNSSYDLELAIFNVSSAGLSGLTKVFPTLKAGSGGGGGGGETLTRATSYAVGDAVTAVGAPGWATLVCTQAGTTAAYEPSGYSRITKAGDMVLDGTAVFTARNIIGELDGLISTTGTLEESMQTLDEKVTEMMSSTGLVMKLVSIEEYRALEQYSASTIYLCYEDAATKRVTRIFVGEDRVYAAGVKVTYQIDTGYSLERTVSDREDAIAAAPDAALEGYTFVGWRQDSSAEKKVLSEFIIGSEEPVTLYAVFKKQMTIGLMHLNANHFLGYDKDEKGNLVINEAQAAIVRRVFDEFMNGLNPEAIAAELNSEGVPGCMGEPKWAVSTIMHILENEKYKGDALLQKYYTSDFLSKKSVRNMGQIEQVYVKDSHPPIVDKELWEAVQLEIERRRLFREKHNLQNMGRYTDVQPFTCKVICGKCGAVCWRRTWTRGSRKIRVWQCGQRYRQKGVAGCKSGNLYEKDLEKAFLMAWNGIVENRESFLPAWKKQITEGNALEKWRAGQMVQLTAEPPLETICPEIVNMVLESVEVHDGGLLHFHFLDGTVLEIETEEE